MAKLENDIVFWESIKNLWALDENLIELFSGDGPVPNLRLLKLKKAKCDKILISIKNQIKLLQKSTNQVDNPGIKEFGVKQIQFFQLALKNYQALDKKNDVNTTQFARLRNQAHDQAVHFLTQVAKDLLKELK